MKNKDQILLLRIDIVILFILLMLSLFNKAEALTITELTRCIEFVESSYNENAYNADELAVGCLQIRPVMLADYNRITGDCLTIDDLWDRWTSYKVAEAVFKHYMKYTDNPTAKHLAFIWNGGGGARHRVDNPKNDQKQKNLERYWDKVQLELTR